MARRHPPRLYRVLLVARRRRRERIADIERGSEFYWWDTYRRDYRVFPDFTDPYAGGYF
jgi:hypothetical protein